MTRVRVLIEHAESVPVHVAATHCPVLRCFTFGPSFAVVNGEAELTGYECRTKSMHGCPTRPERTDGYEKAVTAGGLQAWRRRENGAAF